LPADTSPGPPSPIVGVVKCRVESATRLAFASPTRGVAHRPSPIARARRRSSAFASAIGAVRRTHVFRLETRRRASRRVVVASSSSRAFKPSLGHSCGDAARVKSASALATIASAAVTIAMYLRSGHALAMACADGEGSM
jgi:hypothetical protein